jgi:hypothetical protein
MLEVCPDCGYCLKGLPEEGRCPECGFAYDRELIVVYGFAANDPAGHRLRDQSFPRKRLWTALAIATIPALIIGFSGMASLGGLVPYLIAVVFGIIYSAFRAKRLTKQGIAAPVQLRLTPDGYAQREGVGLVKLTPWPQTLGSKWQLRCLPGHLNRSSFRLARYLGPLVLKYGFNVEIDGSRNEVMALHQKVVDFVKKRRSLPGKVAPEGDAVAQVSTDLTQS